MLILTQNSSVLINTGDISYINTDTAGRVFAAIKGEERPRILGGYDDAGSAKHVLGVIAYAIADGVRVFTMPDEVEIRSEMMTRRSSGPVRRNGGSSHGGT